MFWAGMCGDDHEYWELHFNATTPGLYWYHFELDTAWGKSFIRNVGHGIGDFAPDGNDFQQTVYDEGFTTPDWLKGGLIYQIFPDRFYNSKKPKKNVRSSRVIREWGGEPYWREDQMNGIWNNDYFAGDLYGIIYIVNNNNSSQHGFCHIFILFFGMNQFIGQTNNTIFLQYIRRFKLLWISNRSQR